jgi:aminoglycoside N3'-acetyltransferase
MRQLGATEMAKITPTDVVTVHGELLQAFFQTCLATRAVRADLIDATFAMVSERLRSAYSATEDSGAMSYLNEFARNVKLFAEQREKEH